MVGKALTKVYGICHFSQNPPERLLSGAPGAMQLLKGSGKTYRTEHTKSTGLAMNILEEGNDLRLDFSKIAKISENCKDVIPVAVQNRDTGEVILVAYTNELAFRESVRKRRLVLWSTSRNELWEKGKTSGETFELLEAFVNCEQNSLLYTVQAVRGGICHTENEHGDPRNCYYRRINLDTLELENLDP